jgi:hypothetical protein
VSLEVSKRRIQAVGEAEFVARHGWRPRTARQAKSPHGHLDVAAPHWSAENKLCNIIV